MNDELLTIRDIAMFTKISVRTLWKMISEESFPQPDLRRGKIVRWKRSTLVHWIDGTEGAAERERPGAASSGCVGAAV